MPSDLDMPIIVEESSARLLEPEPNAFHLPAGELVLAPRRRRTFSGGNQATKYGGLYLWAGIILVFAIWVPGTFLTSITAQSIAGDQAVTLILALGLLASLSAGQFDLSVAQTLGLSTVLTALLTSPTYGLSLPLTAVIVLGVGLLIGLVNGVLVAFVGVNSFIATLGMSSVTIAITSIVSSSNFVGPVPTGDQKIVSWQPLGIPVLTIYALIAAVVVWFVLQHSPVGRRLQATGANPEATRLTGIPVHLYTFWALVTGGVVGSLAGFLLSLKIGTVSPDIGQSYLLPAFAACFLGSTQLRPGRFNVWGTVIALYLLATGVKGLQLVSGQTWISDLFNGVALIGAVSLAVISQRRRASHSTSR